MKALKKICTALMLLAFAFVFASCSNGSDSDDDDSSTNGKPSSDSSTNDKPSSVGKNVLAGNFYQYSQKDDKKTKTITYVFKDDTVTETEVKHPTGESPKTEITEYKYTCNANTGLLYLNIVSWTVDGVKMTSMDDVYKYFAKDFDCTVEEAKEQLGDENIFAENISKCYFVKDDGNILLGDYFGDDNVKNNPVNCISWYNALVYCNTRSIQEKLNPCYAIGGKTDPSKWGDVPTSNNITWNAATCDFTANGYRLPTEAEWEWAARGGESYTYAGSYDVNDVAWYTENTNDTGTRDVKTKKANGYRLYDMSGNVWEWCWDWYGSISSDTEGSGPASGSNRCQRGGSWHNYADNAQVAGRGGSFPLIRGYYYGFRLVRNAN